MFSFALVFSRIHYGTRPHTISVFHLHVCGPGNSVFLSHILSVTPSADLTAKLCTEFQHRFLSSYWTTEMQIERNCYFFT